MEHMLCEKIGQSLIYGFIKVMYMGKKEEMNGKNCKHTIETCSVLHDDLQLYS